MSSKNIFFKDNVKTAHWVGHLQLRSIDTEYLFKRTPAVDEKQASVTVNTMKHSVFGRGKNPDLLKIEQENASEETNDDSGVNVEANKVNNNKKKMVVKLKIKE